MRSRRMVHAAVASVVLALSMIIPSGAAAAEPGRATYLVRLADAPLASYRGGLPGLEATSPAALGTGRLDVASAASQAYLGFLAGRQSAVRAAAGVALGRSVAPKFTYRHAYNGMAVDLGEAEAQRFRALPGVVSVRKEFTRRITTDAGPQWIGAPAVWSGAATGGVQGSKGEGVVVGVIDTGVNHDHPSFAATGGDGYVHQNPREQYYGLCGPLSGPPLCNEKLIGIWDFTGTGGLDDNGHGSHTASTAAGNVLEATVNAPTTAITRDISGVAPHANLITYKGCLPTGNCLAPSLVAAIDQATAEGVDVLNYSIGGGPTDPWADDDALAFLGARDAGVFVATSAGNDGPNPETVGSPANAPWVLSVGAGRHDRAFVNSLKDLSGGSGTPPADLRGTSFTSGYGPATIVDAADHGDELCGTPFPPGTFNGEIVICLRGVNPRVEKGRNVELGGAGGMVLVNDAPSGDSTVADAHELPAVHIGHSDGEALRAWAAGGEGHTGTIAGTSTDQRPENGDVLAAFSSRGPNKPVPGVIKPDVTAPGVDVLAAVHSTDPAADPEYGLLSGTSMSSPHAAGAAALVRAVRPEWTPAEVQSAMTSTGITAVRKHDGTTPADAFDIGGGRIDLTKATRAGLVLGATTTDYEAGNPNGETAGDPSQINLASMGSASCARKCSWTRTVRNVTSTTTTWTAAGQAADGVELSVKPGRFRLAPGASATMTITADTVKSTAIQWTFGSVTLSAKGMPAQRLPVAVLPGGTPDPLLLESQGTSGSHVIGMKAPVDIHDFTGTVFGLQQAGVHELQIPQDPTMVDPYDAPVGTQHVLVDVSEGARAMTADITDTTASDLDLFVGRDVNGDGLPSAEEEVCRSASEVALESCSLRAPKAGTYWVLVQNWLTGQVVDDVTLQTGVIPGTDNGNLSVIGPSGPVKAGSPIGIELRWNEPKLVEGELWLAEVRFGSERRQPSDLGSHLVRLTRTG